MSRERESKAREIAFKILFSAEAGGGDVDEILEANLLTDEAQGVKAQIAAKVRTWKKNAAEIDNNIEEHLKRGHIKDLALVARIALRLGLTEMEYIEDIPPEVAINEAVELVKVYGDDDLARFVNGVLDARLKAKRAKGDGDEEGN